MASQELLDEVEAAISAVFLNQSYTLGDRTFRRPDLGELRMMRKDLRAEVARESGTRPTVSVANLNGTF